MFKLSCLVKGKVHMKIVITAEGESLDSRVDQRFGRARYLILYDTDTEEAKPLENSQNMQAMQGAGIQSAQNVIDAGADAVITGNCGPKAFVTLNAGNVEIYQGAQGTVKEAIAALSEGKLTKAEDANVGSHFGSV